MQQLEDRLSLLEHGDEAGGIPHEVVQLAVHQIEQQVTSAQMASCDHAITQLVQRQLGLVDQADTGVLAPLPQGEEHPRRGDRRLKGGAQRLVGRPGLFHQLGRQSLPFGCVALLGGVG